MRTPLGPNGAGRACVSRKDSAASALARFVWHLNWSLLGLLSDLRWLSERAFQATGTALFGDQFFPAAGVREALLLAGQARAFLHLRTLDLVPLAVIRSDLLPLEKCPGLPGEEVKMIRPAARRRYRDLEISLVRAFSRARPSGTVDPFEGVALLKQTCQLSRPSRRPSADELAARLADGVVRLNLATLALLRELPSAGPEGVRVAEQLASDGDGEAVLGAMPQSRVSESLLFLVAVSSPPLSIPAVDRLRELSLESAPEEVQAAGRESQDRFQALLAEFIRISEEDAEHL